MIVSEKCSRGVSSRRRRRPACRVGRAGPVGKSRINQSRWFDPTVGRWLSEDPAAADANLYRYCGNAPTIYVDPSGLAEIKATEELWVAERVGYGKIGDEVFYGTRPWGDYFGNMLDMAPWASASPWYGFSRSLNEKYGASLSLTGGRVEANAVGGGHHFADDPVYQATMKNMKTVAMDKVTVYLPKDTSAEKAVQDGLITKDHTKYDSLRGRDFGVCLLQERPRRP